MKKIRLLIVLFMMFLMPMVALADDSYKFSFKMVKCDPNAEGMTAAKCRNNYLNGSLDSYIIENNGDLEPGSTIMLVGYLSLGTTKTATSFQTTIKYDSTNLTPLTTLKNGAITLLSASPRTADLPYYESEDDEGNIVNVTDWSISANQVDDTIKILADSGDSTMPLSSDLGYMYLFFEVSETATSGSSVSISYDGSAGVTEIADSSVPVNKLSFTVENSTYTVYGSQSGDNSLNTLTITNGSITYPVTPQFETGNSDITEYTAIVPNSISSVNLNATVNNSYAKIGESGLGEKTLSVGDNPFSIVVTAQNGDTETYYIHVYRLSDDATLSEITLTNDITVGTITDEVYVYTANIPYSTKNTNVSATTTHNNAFVESGTGDWTFTNSGDTINTKDIIVKAENCSEIYADVEGNECTSKTYTLNISREAASTNNYLSY